MFNKFESWQLKYPNFYINTICSKTVKKGDLVQPAFTCSNSTMTTPEQWPCSVFVTVNFLQAFTCSKSTMEKAKQCVKFVISLLKVKDEDARMTLMTLTLIVNFKQISHIVLVFPLLNLNNLTLAGYTLFAVFKPPIQYNNTHFFYKQHFFIRNARLKFATLRLNFGKTCPKNKFVCVNEIIWLIVMKMIMAKQIT